MQRYVRAVDTRASIACEKGDNEVAKDADGMRGYRPRTKEGPLRKKRDDTHIGTIEKKYGIDLDARSDMHLGEFLKQHQIKSLNDLITGK